MKKILAIIVLFTSSCTLICAQVNYTVKGKIGAVTDPAKIYLRYVVAGEAKSDSALLNNGSFEFKGTNVSPVRATLVLYHQGARPTGRTIDATSLYLENGTINITAPDSIKNAVVTGSKLNEDYRKLQAQLKPVNEKSAALNDEYNSFTPEQRKDDNFLAPFRKRSEAIGNERTAIYKKFIKENPSTFVSLDNIRMAVGPVPEYNDIAPMFASLSTELKNSPDGKLMAEKLSKLKAVAIGSMAPEFTQNDTSGVPVHLSSFKGKYVLIDFWASWCGPCRAENPNVVKTYDKYKSKNFTVLGVSLDQPNAKAKWLKAIADDHLYWTQVSDLAYWKNAVAELYEVKAIPQNFLIDPSGKIIARDLRGETLDKKLAELLN
jgi:peroxiredoxin